MKLSLWLGVLVEVPLDTWLGIALALCAYGAGLVRLETGLALMLLETTRKRLTVTERSTTGVVRPAIPKVSRIYYKTTR
jgi:hypothetical protein